MGSKESDEAQSSNFQFVTITKPGAGWKNKNEHIVRSHVMRQVRQKQRERSGTRGEKRSGSGNRSCRRYCCPDAWAFYVFLGHLLTAVSSSRPMAADTTEVAEHVVDFVSELPEDLAMATRSHKRGPFDANMPLLILKPSTQSLGARDQRLLDHISNFYSPLISNISPKFVLWSRGMQK